MSKKIPENDVEGIKDTSCWPNYPILPVKSKSHKNDTSTNFPEMGVLVDPPQLEILDRLTNSLVEYRAEAPYTVFAINMFMLGGSVGDVAKALAAAPRRDYVTPENLCEKWRVD